MTRVLLVVAMAAAAAHAQIPEEVADRQRDFIAAGRSSKFLSGKKYDELLAKLDAAKDPEAARAFFRTMVQFAYDHEAGDDYCVDLGDDLQREDMVAIGWEAFPAEVELERLVLHDGRILVGTGGLLALRHPELNPDNLEGQRLLWPWTGNAEGVGKYWIAKEHFKTAGKAKFPLPKAFLSRRGSEQIDDSGRLVLKGQWMRIGKGRVEDSIALDAVDLGEGGTLFANEAEGIRAVRHTLDLKKLRKSREIPAAWVEAYQWDKKLPRIEEPPDESEWVAELRKKAPDVAWPEPFRPDPELVAAAKERKDLIDDNAEASLLRIRFALTYGRDLPALAISDPRAMLKIEDAVRAFLRGGPIDPLLKSDLSTVAAAVRHAPDWDEAPESGLAEKDLYIRFPRGYTGWRRFPLLIVLHGQYREPAYDFQVWSEFAQAAGMILVVPGYGTQAGTARSPKSDEEVLKHVRRFCLHHSANPDRVLLTGISMGGAMSWRLAQSYPGRWCAVGPEIHAPRVYNGKFPYLQNVADLPIYLMEGEFDGLNTIHSRQAVALLQKWEAPITYIEARNYGHERLGWHYPHFLKWASAHKRDAHPLRVEHRAMNAWEGSRAWVSIKSIHKPNAFGMTDGAFHPVDLAGVEAVYEDSVITVKAVDGKPKEVVLRHDAKFMAAEITVKGGRKAATWKVSPSMKFMLERVRETGDREQLYDDETKLSLE